MKKLSLNELKVQSFTTSVDGKTTETVKGGVLYKTLAVCAQNSVWVELCATGPGAFCAESEPWEICNDC